MATAAAGMHRRRRANSSSEWENANHNPAELRGEGITASTDGQCQPAPAEHPGLQGRKRRMSGGKAIKGSDIAIFTPPARDNAEIRRAAAWPSTSSRRAEEPDPTRMLTDIRSDVEGGTSLSAVFRRHPLQFDAPLPQSGRGRRGRASWNNSSTAWRPTGKDDGAEAEEDQVGAGLSGGGAGGGLHRGRDR